MSITTIISGVAALLAHICQDLRETVDHHRASMVFPAYKEGSEYVPTFWSNDPHRRFRRRDSRLGKRLVFANKLTGPVAESLSDAWHAFKVLQNWLTWCSAAAWPLALLGYSYWWLLALLPLSWFVVGLLHFIFYGTLFLRKPWRQKWF